METKEVTVAVPGIFFTSWILMLVLGALHLDVSSDIPHPSYLLTLLVVFAVGVVARFLGLKK